MGRRTPPVAEGSTPVTVVQGPPREGLVRGTAGQLMLALVTAVLTALVLGLAAPLISRYVALAHPTCDDPEGLRLVPPRTITAAGRQGSDPAKVLDGHLGSIWLAPTLAPDDRPPAMSRDRDVPAVDRRHSAITLRLDRARDVRLVCVVNGLANGYEYYANWGRVRTVETWVDGSRDTARASVLRSLDSGSFQNYQTVDVRRGESTRIAVRVLDAYLGQRITSVDPDVCRTRGADQEGRRNDPVGCNLNPTPRVGFAEMAVYEKDWGLADLMPW